VPTLKHARKIVLATAVLLATGVGVAAAATTWTITPGGSIEGSAGTTVFTDTTTGTTLTCVSTQGNSTSKSGSGLTNPLASALSGSANGCTVVSESPTSPPPTSPPPTSPPPTSPPPTSSTAPSATGISSSSSATGLPFSVQPADLPWSITGVSYNGSTGVASGTLSGIEFVLTGSGCTADILGPSPSSTGTVQGTYANGTGQATVLSSGGNLEFWNVAGCAGLFNDGDSATLSATYTITPRQTATSP
jgi:hypothetical protein